MTQLNCFSPVNDSLYITRSSADVKHIDAVLSRAKQGYQAWRLIPLAKRASMCLAAVQYLLANKQGIAEEITWQMGRPIQYGASEIDGFADRATKMIQLAETKLADIEIANNAHSIRYIKRVPLGVVFVIAAWNYPYLTAVNSIIPALMAGNAVLLKHAQQTLLCAERLNAAFTAAGFADIFQILHLSHAKTQYCVQHKAINYVSFTGSVSVGKQIERHIGGQLIGSGFELGGKDPAYVRADADLEQTVKALVEGAFFNSGQSCCAIERIYVAQAIFKQFIARYVALVEQYKMGDPFAMNTTLGPMVNESAVCHIRTQIAEALHLGANTCIANDYFKLNAGQCYLTPQVLINVNHEMSMMREESFGPLIGIMSVKEDAEAIALMNDSDYGLTASIWSSEIKGATQIADRIETGTVFLNRCDYLDPQLAWTGIKNSGRGCSLSEIGYESLTRAKSYHLQVSF